MLIEIKKNKLLISMFQREFFNKTNTNQVAIFGKLKIIQDLLKERAYRQLVNLYSQL